MSSRRAPTEHRDESREATLCRRAFRLRRRGEPRRALLLLREAALGSEHDAKLWVLYGVQCARTGRREEAERALSHAVWLRERAHEPKKARVTRRLLSNLAGPRAA